LIKKGDYTILLLDQNDEETRRHIGESVAALVTEAEHFAAIKRTDELMFGYYYDRSRRALLYPEEKKGEFEAMKFAQNMLLRTIEARFGIVRAERSSASNLDRMLSPGMRDFREWYRSMNENYKKERQEASICGACAFCAGAWEAAEYIPCAVFKGVAMALRNPWTCLMIDGQHCRLERHNFFDMLRAQGGEEAVAVFERRELELKRICAKKIMNSGRKIGAENIGVAPSARRSFSFLLENGFSEADELLGFVGECPLETLSSPEEAIPLLQKT
jgi:hypothetical protein